MTRNIYLVVFFLLTLLTSTKAQNSIDFHFNGFAFLDDHEYNAFIPLRKTISGTRTAFDIGFNVDSLHHFIVGINTIHEFGAHPYFLKANPVAYYSYENKNWLFNAGEFPRQGLLTQYPRALLNDTLSYYRPNVEGLLLRYQTEYGYETGWIDWVSRQTLTDRNQFLAGALGVYIPKPGRAFYISHYFFFMHDAGSKGLTNNGPIEDNGGAQARLGLNYSHRTIMDSLKFEAGAMLSEHRTRGDFGFIFSKGFVASIFMSYKRLAFLMSFIKGSPITSCLAILFIKKLYTTGWTSFLHLF